MSEQKPTKKQHYVPRMYLKRWQCESKDSKEKLLLVISKKSQSNTVQHVSIDDGLFYQDYCYDIQNPDGSLWTSNEVYEVNKVEKEMSRYELKHNRLLDRILCRCEKDDDILDKGTNRIEDFLEFVSLMVVRNPNTIIPFDFDGIQSSTSELNDLFRAMFGDEWKLTGKQVVANSINQRHLFDIVKQVREYQNVPDIYFLRTSDKTCFITSDNPVVLCNPKWSYIPLSPVYAAFILYDTRINCRFEKNRVSLLSREEVQKFNSLYWRKDDTYTIIGVHEKELIDALEIEVRG